ncbi:MAG: TRAM domain-containing protein, partial [Clostridia bacterium]|nr:TRAM domain-containing protein [Clostridia bacterium]
DEFLRAVNLLRSAIPDTSITTDLMVGFAGETDEEFKNSYEFCKKIGFSQMHIFPYSIRKGTAAENFPNQVSELVKTQRSHTMLKLAKEMKEVFYKKYIGKTLPVLLEQKKNNFLHGTTANYMDVLLNVDAGISGEIVNVLITDYQDESLIGEMV